MATDENLDNVPSNCKVDGLSTENVGMADGYTPKEVASVEEKERDTSEEPNGADSCKETVKFRVVWNKKNYEVVFALDDSADNLKQHIEELTGAVHPLYVA